MTYVVNGEHGFKGIKMATQFVLRRLVAALNIYRRVHFKVGSDYLQDPLVLDPPSSSVK